MNKVPLLRMTDKPMRNHHNGKKIIDKNKNSKRRPNSLSQISYEKNLIHFKVLSK
jgi:hypothetical protein